MISNFKELDDALDELEEDKNKESEITEAENKDITQINVGGTIVSIDDEDAITAVVFSSALEDKKKADELYRTMEDRLNFDKDRSPEAKTVLSEAVGHRINATSNLIKILDLRNKSKKVQGNSLVSLNLSERDTGINIKNLTDEILNG